MAEITFFESRRGGLRGDGMPEWISKTQGLTSLLLVLLALPTAIYYTIRIIPKRRSKKLEMPEDRNTVTGRSIWQHCSLTLIHIFALLGVGFFMLLCVRGQLMVVPQSGWGRPFTAWEATVWTCPFLGLGIRWVFLSLFDMAYRLDPSSFRRPYTRRFRRSMGVVFFLLGTAMPWVMYAGGV